ncbi:MAG: pilus assembly protein [Pseudomonadota bacterium]|nr:pilus assembly protein [Pseudomonadota bacterium]
MAGLFHLLRSDRSGTATVELALVAPLLAAFVIGISDVSVAMGRKLLLEQAAQRGIEKIMQTTTDTTVDETIVAEAAVAAGVEEDDVVLDYWLECTAPGGSPVRKGDYNLDTCAANEREARYITLTVTDQFTPMFPTHFAGLDADGTYEIEATSGIRIK